MDEDNQKNQPTADEKLHPNSLADQQNPPAQTNETSQATAKTAPVTAANTSTQIAANKTAKPVTNTPEQKSKGLPVFATINLLLTLAVAVLTFYLFTTAQNGQQAQDDAINKGDNRAIEISKQFSTLQTQLAAMQSQLATFTEDVAGKDNHFSKKLDSFSQLHAEKMATVVGKLTSKIATIERRLSKTRNDWLLADAEYLLTVASQRLHLAGDVQTAIAALKASDQRLLESAGANTWQIRAQIAKEIAALEAVQIADIPGLYAKIQTLKNNAQQLNLLLTYTGKPQTKTQTIASKTDNTLLTEALSLLQKYAVIRYSDQPVDAVLSKQQATFIRQQLQLKLAMVKMALLQRNNTLYQDSIAESQSWLQQHFARDRNTSNFLGQLKLLAAAPINSQFPDIGASIKLLQNVMQRHTITDKSQAPSKAKQPTQDPNPKPPPTADEK